MKLLRAKFALVPVGLLTLAVAVSLSAADGRPLGKVNLDSFTIDPSADDSFLVLHLSGTAEGLGKCTGYAELDVVRGENDTFDGTGVAVFTAANGDLLVGVIMVQRDDAGATSAEVHWRDRVMFHDETTVANTGRFENHRPAGLRISHCCCYCVPCLCHCGCSGCSC